MKKILAPAAILATAFTLYGDPANSAAGGRCGGCGGAESSGPSESPSSPSLTSSDGGDVTECRLSTSTPFESGLLSIPGNGVVETKIEYLGTPRSAAFTINSYGRDASRYTGEGEQKFLTCLNDAFNEYQEKDLGEGVCVKSVTAEFKDKAITVKNIYCQKATPVGHGVKGKIEFEGRVVPR